MSTRITAEIAAQMTAAQLALEEGIQAEQFQYLALYANLHPAVKKIYRDAWKNKQARLRALIEHEYSKR